MQEFDISKKYRLKSNKYKKIILYNDSMKEESDIKQDIVSEFQNELLKKGITNYIWGGYGTNLYINNISINTNNEYIKKTSDVDMLLIYDEKELTNKKQVEYIKYMISSYMVCQKIHHRTIVKLYMVLRFKSNIENKKIIEILMNDGYELYMYNLNTEEGIYRFDFVKILKGIYIKIKIKILKNIHLLFDENIYSYNLLKSYYIKDGKKYNNNIPIDMLVMKKSDINQEILKNTIKKDDKLYHVFSDKYMLYNLMHLYHNYTILNKFTLNKIEKGLHKRDEKRLFYMLKYYCTSRNKNITDKKLKEIFEKLKSSYKDFGESMFKIKNLDMIDKIISLETKILDMMHPLQFHTSL